MESHEPSPPLLQQLAPEAYHMLQEHGATIMVVLALLFVLYKTVAQPHGGSLQRVPIPVAAAAAERPQSADEAMRDARRRQQDKMAEAAEAAQRRAAEHRRAREEEKKEAWDTFSGKGDGHRMSGPAPGASSSGSGSRATTSKSKKPISERLKSKAKHSGYNPMDPSSSGGGSGFSSSRKRPNAGGG